jgi:hypothetical protein
MARPDDGHSFDDIYDTLRAVPGLSGSIGMEKAMQFIRLAALLKGEISVAQSTKYDATAAPETLPAHVRAFLGKAVGLPDEFVHGCWSAFANVIWDYGDKHNEDLEAFQKDGLDYNLGAQLVLTVITTDSFCHSSTHTLSRTEKVL